LLKKPKVIIVSDTVANIIQSLRSEIQYHDQKYYVEAAPEIADHDYDKLINQLQQLESEHPELITADSPTQRVSESPVSHLEQVEHRVPMLSIDNTYSVDELKEFRRRVVEGLDGQEPQWAVELKIDGVAVALIYENGILKRAVTRGNGKVGDDITHNVRTIVDVPLKLNTEKPPALLEIRGEVYMTNQELVRLNQQQQSAGEPLYKNTRNVSAGTVRLLDSQLCASRNLRIFCHGTGYCEGLESTNHKDFLAEIASYGLVPTPMVQVFDDFDGVINHCQHMIERLGDLDFEVDGIVVKVNDFRQRQQLGIRSKSPRWIAAYKWEKYEAVTRLNAITVQVGKTGTITPVAELEPVELAGTTVSRASLHNAEEVQRKDIRVGDVVVVEKAGKIIPHIVRVELTQRPKDLPAYDFPTVCPACGTCVIKDEGGVYIRCPNFHCPAQVKERIRYFATRNAMDIEGLGDKLVEQLVDAKLVLSYADLYRLSAADLLKLPRMGEKSCEKVLAAIQVSKSQGLGRLLNALSVRHVGGTVSELLANHYQNMDQLLAASQAELGQLNEVGEVIAASVYEFFSCDVGRTIVAELRELGLKLEQDVSASSPASDVFSGQTFVVTGTLPDYGRDQIHAMIKANGGKVGSSISKATTFLVAGEKAGSKLQKASALGVKVVDQAGFLALLP